jgi:hypothetical protein
VDQAIALQEFEEVDMFRAEVVGSLGSAPRSKAARASFK